MSESKKSRKSLDKLFEFMSDTTGENLNELESLLEEEGINLEASYKSFSNFLENQMTKSEKQYWEKVRRERMQNQKVITKTGESRFKEMDRNALEITLHNLIEGSDIAMAFRDLKELSDDEIREIIADLNEMKRDDNTN